MPFCSCAVRCFRQKWFNFIYTFRLPCWISSVLRHFPIILLFVRTSVRFDVCFFSPVVVIAFHWYSLPVDGGDRSIDIFIELLHVTKLICFPLAVAKWNWFIIKFQPRCSDVFFIVHLTVHRHSQSICCDIRVIDNSQQAA